MFKFDLWVMSFVYFVLSVYHLHRNVYTMMLVEPV